LYGGVGDGDDEGCATGVVEGAFEKERDVEDDGPVTD
jgi:hypothetical protein